MAIFLLGPRHGWLEQDQSIYPNDWQSRCYTEGTLSMDKGHNLSLPLLLRTWDKQASYWFFPSANDVIAVLNNWGQVKWYTGQVTV